MILKDIQQPSDEFAALYRRRSDGDWDFVASLSIDQDTFPPANGHPPLDFLGLIASQVKDHTLIVFSNEPGFPAVYVKDPEGLAEWHPNLD